MSNENTPAQTASTNQPDPNKSAATQPGTQPSGEPKREGEQKVTPAEDKNEPARK